MTVNLYDPPFELTYFNLEIINRVSISYDLNNLPFCELNLICNSEEKTKLENGLKADTLPLFLDKFKPDTITFTENNTHKDPFNLYIASISFKHYLADILDLPISPLKITPEHLAYLARPESTGEITLKTTDLKIEGIDFKIQAPIGGYRIFQILEIRNFLTTIFTEMQYLYENYALIINHRSLTKNFLALIPYGKLLKKTTLNPEYILDRKLSSIPAMNFKILPTIIWRSRLVRNPLSDPTHSKFDAFNISKTNIPQEIETSPEFLALRIEANPLSDLNPFSKETLNPSNSSTDGKIDLNPLRQ